MGCGKCQNGIINKTVKTEMVTGQVTDCTYAYLCPCEYGRARKEQIPFIDETELEFRKRIRKLSESK